MDSSVPPKDEIWFLRVSSHFKRSLPVATRRDVVPVATRPDVMPVATRPDVMPVATRPDVVP